MCDRVFLIDQIAMSLNYYIIGTQKYLSLKCKSTSSPNGWMDDLQFYILFNRISVILGRQEDDNAWLCAMEPHLLLRRSRPALNPLSYRGSCKLRPAMEANKAFTIKLLAKFLIKSAYFWFSRNCTVVTINSIHRIGRVTFQVVKPGIKHLAKKEVEKG